jgi:hypothetical protein
MLRLLLSRRAAVTAAAAAATGILLSACGGRGTSPPAPLGNVAALSQAANSELGRHSSPLPANRFFSGGTLPADVRNVTESSAKALLRDDSGGQLPVDPNTLHPKAIADLGNGPKHVSPYSCWSVDAPPFGSPPATAILCFHPLWSEPDNDPPGGTFFTGFGCPGGFATAERGLISFIAVRYYDKNSNMLGEVAHFKFSGQVFNTSNDKGTNMFADTVVLYRENPVDGTRNNEFVTILGNDFAATANGQVLAQSAGILSVDPTGKILYEIGSHPVDDYFLKGDTSGILPVCQAIT